MPADTNWNTICPHCGFESEDSSMCQACGRLMDESLPVRPFSLSGILSSFSSVAGQAVQWKSWDMNDETEFNENLRSHPSYAFNPGNIFYKNEE